MSVTWRHSTGSPTRTGTIWLSDGMTGRPAATSRFLPRGRLKVDGYRTLTIQISIMLHQMLFKLHAQFATITLANHLVVMIRVKVLQQVVQVAWIALVSKFKNTGCGQGRTARMQIRQIRDDLHFFSSGVFH